MIRGLKWPVKFGKSWLQDSCHSKRLGSLGHGTHFEKSGTLGADGVHLSGKENSIFGNRLAKRVKRASN